MDKSLHYLAMANQQLIQKQLLERVKSAGLTLGQPKVLDFLKDHDGASQKDIAAGCFIEAGSLTEWRKKVLLNDGCLMEIDGHFIFL